MVDERKPGVADELGGAESGEAHQGEDGHGTAQKREEQVCNRGREVVSDVVGGGICKMINCKRLFVLIKITITNAMMI